LPARYIAPNASTGTPRRNRLTQRDGFRILLPSLGRKDLRCDLSQCAFSHRVHAFFKDLLFCIRIALDVPYPALPYRVPSGACESTRGEPPPIRDTHLGPQLDRASRCLGRAPGKFMSLFTSTKISI
jgi:hypothetical protein